MSQFTSDSLSGWNANAGHVFLPQAVESVEQESSKSSPEENAQPQAHPAKVPSSRYNSLDLWRGVACIMLVLYHATFYGDYHFRLGEPSTWSLWGLPLYLIRFCWVGVPIFFVISGYCIAASVESHIKRRVSLKDYFVRRIRRIYPPLWTMCGIAIAFTWIVSSWPIMREHCHQLPDLAALSVWQWIGNFMAAESWRHNVLGGESAYLMANTWTLCYEEQFYIVTGLLLAFAPRRFFQATAWLTAGVIVVHQIQTFSGRGHEGFFWDGHWIMFAAGILVYRTLNFAKAENNKRRVLATIAVFSVGMMYAMVSRFMAKDYFDRHLAEYLFIGCSFAIGLLFLRRWDRQICSLRILAPLRWCGQRSYSIYLTHFLIVVSVSSLLAYGGLRSEWQVALIVVPICCLLSLPAAILFYEFVERRFTNIPATTTSRDSASA
jgi:peptidoglycan/LPS O-acetylase OafA/YrhL